jgi:ABC-type branched-subunit amino acid transport system substrate-binding protein
VQLVPVDAGRSPAAVAREVAGLQAAGAIDVLVGFSTSDVHRAVRTAVAGRLPHVFTPPHEGGRSPGVLRIGHDPLAQHGPGLAWLVTARRARRWLLVGTDYVWPRAVHRAARRVLAGLGAEVVGEALVPFGPRDVGPLLDLVRRSRADGVLLSLVGRDLVAFNREFARAGLDRRVVRLSGALEENGLYALGGDGTGELYACMPSFAAVDGSADPDQLALEERRAGRTGSATGPVVCAYARGVYDGVRAGVVLAGGRRPAVTAPVARVARAEGLAFRELPLDRG